MRLAKVVYTDGEIHDANINRSPEAYEANPQKERDMWVLRNHIYLFICEIILYLSSRYQYNTDHGVSQINIFDSKTNEPMGVINWFPVHGVSMNSSNQLISGDHKGLASQLLEKYINPKTQLSGTVSVCKFFYFHIDQ